MPYVAAAFIAVAAGALLVELNSEPSRGLHASWVFLVEAAVLAGATWSCRRPGWQDHSVGLCSAALAAIPVLSAIYHLLVGIEAELLAMSMVYMVAATAVFVPWGARGQISVAGAAVASFGAVLLLGLPAPIAPGLDFAGVLAVSALSVGGAHLLASYRRDLLRANRDLRSAYEALKAAGQTKNEFIANLSHELRTPLNTIVGYTDLLLDDDFGELGVEMRAPIERISKSADNLRALINDLIDLALIETGRLRVDIREVPLAPLFDELAAQAEPMLRDKPVHFRYREPSALTVRADGVRLRQILTNLVGNAAKYTPQGEIELRAVASNGGVQIHVSDTGVGVPKEEMEAIFTPFYRGTRRGNAIGVGLGLSMSARLAELMGGEITVDSEVGKGSRFTLHLSA